jgi:hypothetical protein
MNIGNVPLKFEFNICILSHCFFCSNLQTLGHFSLMEDFGLWLIVMIRHDFNIHASRKYN